MPDRKIRAVFDCNVYLQILINEESVAARCFGLARRGDIEIFISEPTFLELIEVLSRPKVLAFIPVTAQNELAFYLAEVKNVARTIRNCPRKFRFSRDPDDEPYINLAIAAKADYIVSRDSDLLSLMTDHTDEAKEFRQKYRHITIVDPVEFLSITREIDLALEP